MHSSTVELLAVFLSRVVCLKVQEIGEGIERVEGVEGVEGLDIFSAGQTVVDYVISIH